MDAVRGDVPRSKFVQRALEAALGSKGFLPVDRSVSPRAPANDAVPPEQNTAIAPEYFKDMKWASQITPPHYGPRRPRGKPFQK